MKTPPPGKPSTYRRHALAPGTLCRFRIALGLFIVGLIASGVTAFPLLGELRFLDDNLNSGHLPMLRGLTFWIDRVYQGLENTDRQYPWIAYGTDWLAFAHLMIAVFFIGPMIDPRSGKWILISGLIACFSVIPLALICGAIRGIPFYWRLVDCSFGVIGAVPLVYFLKLIAEMD